MSELRQFQPSQEKAPRYIQMGKHNVWLQIRNTENPGPTVIALSGGPGYSHLDVERFADTGLQTAFFDNIGVGESNTQKLTDEDYDQICTIESFVGQISEVQTAVGEDRVVLVAHSSGGSFAVLYALEHPEKVAGLVLVEPMLSGERAKIDGATLIERIKKGAKERMKQLEQAGQTESSAYQWYQNAFIRRHLFGKKLADRKHLPTNLQASEEAANHTIYERMVGRSEIDPDMRAPLLTLELIGELARIVHIPTLFVGGRNGLITPATLELLHEAMPGSELAILEGSSHFPHESEPLAFRDKVTDFIQRRVSLQAA